MQKPDNRGGKRPGAGRKPMYLLGEQKRREIIKDIEAVAEKRGSSIGKEIGEMMFGRGKDKRLKMQAMQLYLRDILPKASEQPVSQLGIASPFIFKPEDREALDAKIRECKENGLPVPPVMLPELIPLPSQND